MSGLLKLENVSVIRGGQNILGPINWSLNQGERWVVIGPNGAGKTTFLQLIAALIHPSRGRVEILGEEMGRVDVFELRPRIGISSAALQEYLPQDERVVDLVLTAAYAITGRWIEEYDLWDESRAKALLDVFGVRELAERTFGTLSEGERKRVQIARSLMANPEILLLDEPAAGLDLGGREDILNRISNFLDEPGAPSSVIVTHHIEEIPRGTTHVLLLKSGIDFAAGEISDVLTEENLNTLFNVNVALRFDGNRYSVISQQA
ncbi:MAG: ABC transporter ATP-binding protein [Candidatus Nanopelagicaceae bacterium]|jgi:iron complex transport system ATP-binding protein